ncbi:uncharacterized protein N7459_006233 [Penicillium hispanicum]|uniref:uncharacterized protein n=1 Tax=Penicillium hispanicum TaxID=1080232 RepID=UPI0025421242|nr:uncharacterized protein N7459_006233 [Penicillium hispanicum]KAJ5580248.1 hypothetical protein N7459_006233 [Penicillium hispanicum]
MWSSGSLAGVTLVALISSPVLHARYAPGPAGFPLTLHAADASVSHMRARLDDAIDRISQLDLRTESWAVQLTSSEETLWSSFSTARALPEHTVNGDTAFRIASISKTITVYALLREQSISLDDPVTRYIPELILDAQEPWHVQWDQVSLRSLASFLSGISRDTGGPCFVWREVSEMGDFAQYGLPKIHKRENATCTSSDIIERARVAPRVFALNDRPTYSNAAFSLLGIVLERATGLPFHEAVDKLVLDPLGMRNTTTKTPAPSTGIVPPIPNHWGIPLGAADATAGFYSTSNDMSRYLRSILNAELLPRHTINGWLKPHAWTDAGASSAYGLAWEFLRTTRATSDGRPLDVISKAGALHGYHSFATLIPEYGLGLTVMVAGNPGTMQTLRETVVQTMVPFVEDIARDRAVNRYAGVYRSGHGDNGTRETYLRLGVDPDGPGLYIAEWVSNNADFLTLYGSLEGMPEQAGSWSARLIPASVEPGMNWEMWRVVCVGMGADDTIFGDLHLTDVDDLEYGGRGLGDIRIRLDEHSYAVEMDVPVLGVKLQRMVDGEGLWHSELR